MNERIKLLAEQAGFTEGGYESDDGPWIGPEFDKEKFAELLVRECMLQCDVPESGNTPLSKDFNEGHIMGVYECFHKIKNHFGVEE